MRTTHAFLFVSLCLLGACSGGSVKETLGIGSRAPDEFRVVSRPPLSVPPQFNLRPPGAGSSAAAVPASKQAESAVLGRPVDMPEDGSSQTFSLKPGTADTAVAPVQSSGGDIAGGTSAESQLLRNAGADKADPGVRSTLTEEKIAVQERQEDAAWWEIWNTKPEKKDPLVDAKKEAERVKKNQDEGKPVNEGETPEVRQRDRGVIGRILGD